MIDLLKLFRFLRPKYVILLIISTLILIISVAFRLIEPQFIEWAIDNGIRGKDTKIVLLGGAGILLMAIISGGLNFLSGYFTIKTSQKLSYDIRNNLYKKVMSFSFSNLDKWRTGELMVRLYSDVDKIKMFIRMGLFMMVQSIIMIIGSSILMYNTDNKLGRIMLIILPSILLLFFVFAYIIKPMFLKMREKLDTLNNVLQENLSGSKVVRAFARQDYEIKRFEVHNRDLLNQTLKVGYLIAVIFPFLILLANLTSLIAIWLGGISVVDGEMSLGKLIAFNNYTLMATFPILMLGMVLAFVSMATASAKRIAQVFNEEPAIKEIVNPIIKKEFKGNIEFKNVFFHYGSESFEGEYALENINLKINAGEKIGILGGTGAGKSSIANLIPRLYEPQKGEILVDGIEIKKLSLVDLRKKISTVLQETFLFSGTIKDNIKFGNPNSTDDEIERASEIACAKEFILAKDNQWDEVIGERGAGLSGGQRQRIAIARTILAQPDIIILDDATASVDVETENKLFNNIYNELKNKTVIIISQKISSIKNADKIILIDNGKIQGMGNHKELLENNELYKEIYDTQHSKIS